MNWLIRPWRHAFDYKGRSPRREYWLFWGQFFIGIFLIVALTGLVTDAIGAAGEEPGLEMIPFWLFFVACLAVGLAVAVRRFHDQDKSGWYVLIYFIPFVGGIIFLILMLMPGSGDWNSYGDDPRLGEEAARQNVAEIFS
jgi:uncharacterized membrane protein YhaH (DUF805 family)